MNKLERTRLPSISWKDSELEKTYLYTLEGSPYAMLISSSGRTLFFTRELADLLLCNKPTKSLMSKLERKGFCRSANVSQPICEIAPKFFMIDITTKCNMNCYYCLRHFEDSGEIISEKTLQDILDYIIRYYQEEHIETLEIQPWGGEPTLSVDRIVFIRQYLDKHHIKSNITIQSNGLALTEEIARRLWENQIGIGFSIDGCQEIQDMHRRDLNNRSSFDRVRKGIERWRDVSGKTPGTISVVSKMSLPYLEQSIESLVKDIGIRNLKMNLMHPNSALSHLGGVVDVTDIEGIYHVVMDKVVSLHEEGYAVSEANTADRVSNLLYGACPDLCHSRGCEGGYRLISFSQTGGIFPCETIGIKKFQLGTIYENRSLKELIQSSIDAGNPYYTKKTDNDCADCEWFPFCRGGCTASAYFHGRKPGQIDEKECAINRTVYREIVFRLLCDPSSASKLTNGEIVLN